MVESNAPFVSAALIGPYLTELKVHENQLESRDHFSHYIAPDSDIAAAFLLAYYNPEGTDHYTLDMHKTSKFQTHLKRN